MPIGLLIAQLALQYGLPFVLESVRLWRRESPNEPTLEDWENLLIKAGVDAGANLKYYTFYAHLAGGPTAIGAGGADVVYAVMSYSENVAPEIGNKEAEAFIAEALRDQPHATYLLAQAVIVQDQALGAANERLQQLEARVRELEGERRVVEGRVGEVGEEGDEVVGGRL